MKHWKVKGPALRKRGEIIAADYVVLQTGCLIFRVSVRGFYPDTVCVIAPGAWSTMERLYDGETKTVYE